MKKIAIVYASYHHGNTKKVLDSLKANLSLDLEVNLYDVLNSKYPILEDYETVGFASGIYAFGVHRKLQNYVSDLQLEDSKKSFLIYTCGSEKLSLPSGFLNSLKSKGFEVLGSEFCLGYDTFGPLKLVGGVNKNRPNEADFKKIIDFVEKII